MSLTGMQRIGCAVVLTLFVAGCADGSGAGGKETFGTLLGGVAGAALGSQFGSGGGRVAATAIGAIGGAFIGNAIGKSMDKTDRLYARRANQYALESAPTGQSTAWNNPDSGNSGVVTPTRTYQNDNGQYCREFQHEVIVGGQPEQAYGRACRQPDGSWLIQN